ncbi:hypothetical protein FZEAL_6724 [Fusarium zealandicum]|uniref:Uncharacterized protein n=1 Tax=Fusarium zealandicum TaxID=1053134 RepID=A0A8H4XJC1_9HYPO|nr:hypothetical protein FZEAL_6724 [Fusarium zealandicum]
MEHLNGPVLLCSFFMSSVAYWHAFLVVEYLLRTSTPSLYERLQREDILRKLNPLLLMLTRMVIGLVVSLPACVQAASTTPWGVGYPLNTSGQICIVSQVAVWSNELPLTRYYSSELFVHHLLCLVATANIVISPPVHQIKPLYLYFASLVGDIGPGSVMVFKVTGRQPETSRLMYYAVAASTSILIFCRVGCAFYTLTHVLVDPYNLADWVWALAVMLFGSYSLFGALRNLRWLGIVGVDPVRFRATYFYRFMVPMSHSVLAAACGGTLLSTLFIYGLYLDRPLRPLEIGFLSMHGLVSAAIGLTGTVVTRIAYPYNASRSDPWGSWYLQLGVLLAGVWASKVTMFTDRVERGTFLSALGINLPLFQAIARMAHYYCAKDAAAVSDEKVFMDNIPARIHLEMALGNATIFLVSLILLTLNILTASEAARMTISACILIQLSISTGILPLAVANSHGYSGFLLALALSALGPCVVLFGITAHYIRPAVSIDEAVYNYLLLGGTIVAAINSTGAAGSRPCAVLPKPRRRKTWKPYAAVFMFMCILQVMLVKKHMNFEAEAPEVSVGFKNFRAILSDPVTWVVSPCEASRPREHELLEQLQEAKAENLARHQAELALLRQLLEAKNVLLQVSQQREQQTLAQLQEAKANLAMATVKREQDLPDELKKAKEDTEAAQLEAQQSSARLETTEADLEAAKDRERDLIAQLSQAKAECEMVKKGEEELSKEIQVTRRCLAQSHKEKVRLSSKLEDAGANLLRQKEIESGLKSEIQKHSADTRVRQQQPVAFAMPTTVPTPMSKANQILRSVATPSPLAKPTPMLKPTWAPFPQLKAAESPRSQREQYLLEQLEASEAELEVTKKGDQQPSFTASKRPRTETVDCTGFWEDLLKDARDKFGNLPVSKNCRISSGAVVPSRWSTAQDDMTYKGLVHLLDNGGLYEWRCFGSIHRDGLKAMPIQGTRCPRYCNLDCLQYQLVMEDGVRRLDFRLESQMPGMPRNV